MSNYELTVWGLVLNIAGTTLLLVWPPQVRRWTKDGRQEITLVNNPIPHGTARYWVQLLGTRSGLLLLMMGFALQLFAVLRGT